MFCQLAFLLQQSAALQRPQFQPGAPLCYPALASACPSYIRPSFFSILTSVLTSVPLVSTYLSSTVLPVLPVSTVPLDQLSSVPTPSVLTQPVAPSPLPPFLSASTLPLTSTAPSIPTSPSGPTPLAPMEPDVPTDPLEWEGSDDDGASDASEDLSSDPACPSPDLKTNSP